MAFGLLRCAQRGERVALDHGGEYRVKRALLNTRPHNLVTSFWMRKT